MSDDQELRNKLASGWASGSNRHGLENIYASASESFCAGWDAARANPQLIKDSINMLNIITSLSKECDQLREQLQWSLRNEQQYKDELKASLERENQLRAENKYLRTMALNPLSVNDMDETIRLKAQCEKLAEALDDILMAVPSLSAVLKIARENLAEYRKSKGE